MSDEAATAVQEVPTGAHPSVQLGELREIAEIRARNVGNKSRWYRWFFRIFRFEEAIILGLLATFVTAYLLVTGAPSTKSLERAFTYNFHGHGTFWMFILWCVVGTGFLELDGGNHSRFKASCACRFWSGVPKAMARIAS